jgi:hypothetical protein
MVLMQLRNLIKDVNNHYEAIKKFIRILKTDF